MQVQIDIDKNKCVGCRTCELACSFQKTKMFNPDDSNIKIYFDDESNLVIKIFAPCDCSATLPLCYELCPVDAIKYWLV
ncbi:MAG: 4Fe-4S binding protein [Armatimonadetes bacterium]|nr:4Fe-4S binding protein [Armatimonadota bacterium]